MKEYGGETVKGTWLYCNLPIIKDISLFKIATNNKSTSPRCSAELVRKEVKNGRVAITGNPEALKNSQHYPIGFGRAVASVIAMHAEVFKTQIQTAMQQNRRESPNMLHYARAAAKANQGLKTTNT